MSADRYIQQRSVGGNGFDSGQTRRVWIVDLLNSDPRDTGRNYFRYSPSRRDTDARIYYITLPVINYYFPPDIVQRAFYDLDSGQIRNIRELVRGFFPTEQDYIIASGSIKSNQSNKAWRDANSNLSSFLYGNVMQDRLRTISHSLQSGVRELSQRLMTGRRSRVRYA